MKKMFFHKYNYVLLTLFLAVIFNLVLLKTGVKFTKEHYNLTEKENKIVLLFRNDDISAYSDPVHEEQVLALFKKYNIRQLFGIIPKRMIVENEKDAQLVENQKVILQKLKQWKKSGLIDYGIHGYTHMKSRGSSGEFRGLSYNDQYAKIKAGKEILDKLLDDNVESFVPPWNQADINTLKACKDTGVKLFSGYLGEYPRDGIVLINSNATLISKDYYKKTGLKNRLYNIEELVPYFGKIKGIQIITVLYHSRTDFKDAGNFDIVKNLLLDMSKNKKIEFSDIESVQKKYINELKIQNLAGLNIKEANEAIHLARPYRILLHLFYKSNYFEDKIASIYENYWIADFSRVQSLVKKIINKCKLVIIVGRYSVFAILLAVYLGVKRFSRKNDIISWLFLISFVFAVMAFILNQTEFMTISSGRRMECIRLTFLNIILICIIYINSKRNYWVGKEVHGK